jgi:hypothetical protein
MVNDARVGKPALRVAWPGDLEGNKDLFAGVQRANKVLSEELGRSKGLVIADWKLVRDDQNRSILELILTDAFTKSQVTETFVPDEFRNDAHLGSRFHRMWGNLLQARSDGQIKRLEELVAQEEGT